MVRPLNELAGRHGKTAPAGESIILAAAGFRVNGGGLYRWVRSSRIRLWPTTALPCRPLQYQSTGDELVVLERERGRPHDDVALIDPVRRCVAGHHARQGASAWLTSVAMTLMLVLSMMSFTAQAQFSSFLKPPSTAEEKTESTQAPGDASYATLADLLENETARATLIEQLRALAAGQVQADGAAPAAAPDASAAARAEAQVQAERDAEPALTDR